MDREYPAIVSRPPTDSVAMHAEGVEAAAAAYLRASRETPANGSLMAGALQSMRARIARLESAHAAWVNAHYLP